MTFVQGNLFQDEPTLQGDIQKHNLYLPVADSIVSIVGTIEHKHTTLTEECWSEVTAKCCDCDWEVEGTLIIYGRYVNNIFVEGNINSDSIKKVTGDDDVASKCIQHHLLMFHKENERSGIPAGIISSKAHTQHNLFNLTVRGNDILTGTLSGSSQSITGIIIPN